jgi:hypothetical protein
MDKHPAAHQSRQGLVRLGGCNLWRIVHTKQAHHLGEEVARPCHRIGH